LAEPESLFAQTKYRFWIAGSTHPGEEEIILQAFRNLQQKFKDVRLIIAPRHIERAKTITQLTKTFQLNPVLFSQKRDGMLASGDVLIIDTIGHLRFLYKWASVVFVGKSLIGKGGQNIIEPALYAKPVIIGPHMQNFKKITEIFLQAKAVIQIQNKNELEKVVYDILSSPARGQALGLAAYNVVLQHQGATSKTLQKILSLLPIESFRKIQ
jgi:3-deoxy-D-manno-octulosonic-acid transferase